MSGEGLYVGRPWNGLLGVWQWMGGNAQCQWRPAIVPPLSKILELVARGRPASATGRARESLSHG